MTLPILEATEEILRSEMFGPLHDWIKQPVFEDDKDYEQLRYMCLRMPGNNGEVFRLVPPPHEPIVEEYVTVELVGAFERMFCEGKPSKVAICPFDATQSRSVQ